LPPLTLIPGTTVPFPFAPPALPPAVEEFPLQPAVPEFRLPEPPGEPGCFPSGEIVTFAERLPEGTGASGLAGPGEAESAMMR